MIYEIFGLDFSRSSTTNYILCISLSNVMDVPLLSFISCSTLNTAIYKLQRCLVFTLRFSRRYSDYSSNFLNFRLYCSMHLESHIVNEGNSLQKSFRTLSFRISYDSSTDFCSASLCPSNVCEPFFRLSISDFMHSILKFINELLDNLPKPFVINSLQYVL